MNELSKRAFADVARGVLIAVAFGSFAVGIYHSGPAIAETSTDMSSDAVNDTAFRLEVNASIADLVIDVATISGVLTITENSDERCDTDPTSI